ncbi:sirohydrochlorin cobaltochelatase [Clostridium peptidivorans]|uniref:sirohydrochlorin cobaltochelatase n=1 Tax=Clostridium peptidivorans TaxID=100174 RepID=UPI000BE2A5B5|nr:sirohydrochlorin cobaltochelatase [Clostridium peptidivorans]
MKKGILVVSFGTSYMETLKLNIEACENKIRESFKEYEIRRAFTSGMIMRKLKQRDNIHIDTVEEALTKMVNDGFEEIIVQPLHIMPGEEYDDIKRDVHKFSRINKFENIVLGRPVLYSEEDYRVAVEALKEQLPEYDEKKAVVLMGHGSTHYANACYSMLQYIFEDMGVKNVYIATVEGFPELRHVVPKLKEKKIEEITLMPYMLVAGDHAQNDMAGDEEDSWKVILENEGFKVNIYLHGLGENSAYRDIYVQHIKDCINN